MACERYREKLSEAAASLGGPHAAEGEMQALVRDPELRTHLAGCAACRKEFEVQRQLLEAMDRNLTASLGQEPSPEFAARVRHRLSEAPVAGRSWWFGWAPIAAATLAVLAMAAVWLARREPAPPGRPEPVTSVAQSPAAPDTGAPPAAVDRPAAALAKSSKRPTVPRGGAGERSVRAQAAVPEVLVLPGQEEGILRFYAAVRSGRVDVSSLLREPRSSEPEELKSKIVPLEVAPLEAKPLEPGKGQ